MLLRWKSRIRRWNAKRYNLAIARRFDFVPNETNSSEMEGLNILLRAGAGVALLGLLTCIAWVLTHLRRIRREALKDEAMPRSGPKANFLVLIGTVAIALVSLLTYCLIEMR